MELYKKISVTDEKPLDKTPLFLVQITGAKNQNFPEDGNDWQFYLEEISDPTAQLKADKAELLSALEKCWEVVPLDTYEGRRWFDEIDSLIKKHKQ